MDIDDNVPTDRILITEPDKIQAVVEFFEKIKKMCIHYYFTRSLFYGGQWLFVCHGCSRVSSDKQLWYVLD